MTQITFAMSQHSPKIAPERERPGKVIGSEGADAPSPRGSTFYKSLFRCPHEHALLYELGIAPLRRSEALDLGFLYHAGLETYYRTIMEFQQVHRRDDAHDFWWGATADAEQAVVAEVVDPVMREPGYERTHPELSKLLGAYFNMYRRRDRWEIVAVEETIFHDDPTMPYSARVDLIVMDEKERMWIVEHKTARFITEDLIYQYHLDPQILGQAWLVLNCIDLDSYPPFAGVVPNIISKHVNPRFERVQVIVDDAHLDAFERTITQWWALRKVVEAAGWPKTLNCSGPARGYTTCPFYDLCMGHADATIDDWREAELPPTYRRKP